MDPPPPHTNSLSILQWNCNSARARKAELMELIRTHNPDIIALQETKIPPKKRFRIPQYQIIRKDRPTQNSAAGGTLLALKSNLNYSQINLDSCPLEHTAVTVYMQQNEKIHLFNIYNPPLTDLDLDFIATKINPETDKYIIIGDLNAHHPSWTTGKPNRSGHLLYEFIEENNLAINNKFSITHLHSASTSTIDLSINSANLSLKTTAYTLNHPHGSDHIPVITLVTGKSTNPPRTEKYNLKKADFAKFQQLLTTELLYKDHLPDHEQDYAFFINTLTDAANASIPKSKPTSHHKSVPYWNKNCKEAVKKRNKAFKNYKSSNSIDHLIEYKKEKATTQKLIRSTQKESWTEYCNSLNSQTKLSSVWRMAKCMAGTHSASAIPTLLTTPTPAISENEKANALASHFAAVSSNQNFDQKFQRKKAIFENLYKDQSPTIHAETAYLNDPIAPFELEDAIKSSKRNKAPGEDGILYEFLKHLPFNGVSYLLHIYNNLWKNNLIIENWKTAIIMPLLKQNENPSAPASYRPIALLSTLSKIYEKIITRRLVYHLEKTDIFSKFQAGFRKNRSTLDQLIKLHNAAYHAINNKHFTRAIFIDFSKAFDMVWTEGLLYKLRNLKIHGNLYNAIKLLLTNRSIKVRVNSTLSDSHSIQNGVPQGSTLAPILFLIFINDFPILDNNTASSSIFADDCAFWLSGRNLHQITTLLNDHLKKVKKWSENWGLQINVKKTVNVIFTNRKIKNPPDIILNKTQIKTVTDIKFLGMILDSRLHWKKHIDYIKEKSQSAINLLRSLTSHRWGASKSLLLTLYTHLIKSKILYGGELYYSATKQASNKLNTIQYQALKIIAGAIKTTSLTSLQNELGQPPLFLESKKLLYRHLARAQLTPNNPATTCLQSNWQTHYGKFKQPPIPLQCQAIDDLLATINEKPILPDTPFWRLKPPSVDIDLTDTIKKSSDTSPDILLSKALEHINLFEDHTACYTDGSKLQSGSVGYGVYFPSLRHSISAPLHYTHSIFQAELAAISAALDHISSLPSTPTTQNFVIFSDSLSALKTIKNFIVNYHNHQIAKILEHLTNLTLDKKRITLCWVPSHIGIKGNEEADRLANLASNQTPDYFTLTHSIGLTTAYGFIDKIIIDLWQKYYDSKEESNHYKLIQPTVSFKVKYQNANREKDVIITRLRLGKAALNKFLQKIKKHPNGCCDHCPTKPETITHFLIECPHYQISKDIDHPTLPTILSDPLLTSKIYEQIKLANRKL